MEDITDGFVKPNIMDIKIGAQTWGPDASQKKITQEKAKYVGTKGPYGFSILGMLVHAFNGDVPFKKFDKSFGKNLKQEDVLKVPETYFNHEQEPPIELIEIFVEKISEILEVFMTQRKYKIYASSLLLAYDAQAVQKFKANAKNHDEKKIDKKNELRKHVNIRLIDFAHVFNANGDKDENFIFGLTNLLDLFQRYLNQF